jgi:LmbE family N-acetylglucosaminyl deacetylase
MAVFAHPDDEAFGTGGTLSKYAAEGCDVTLVTATRGEAGEIAEPELATSADLPLVREQELRSACEIYGIHPPRFLDYADGLLPIVHQGQAVGKVVQLIRELKPQVVITFGPDGIYGHYDLDDHRREPGRRQRLLPPPRRWRLPAPSGEQGLLPRAPPGGRRRDGGGR